MDLSNPTVHTFTICTPVNQTLWWNSYLCELRYADNINNYSYSMDYNNLQPVGINHHMNPSKKVYPTAAEHRLNHDTSSQRSRVRKNFDLLSFF